MHPPRGEDVLPFDEVCPDACGKPHGCRGCGDESELLERAHELGVAQRLTQHRVQPLRDRLGRARRSEEAEPERSVVAFHAGFAHRRHVGQRRIPLRAGNGEHLHAAAHPFHYGRAREGQLELAAEQRRHDVVAAFVRHVREVARREFGASSVSELSALAKAKPGDINYGSQGTGAAGHLSGELLQKMTGIRSGLSMRIGRPAKKAVMFSTVSRYATS